MMRVVKPDAKGLRLALSVIKKNGVVVYPTDTAYALGGYFNSLAVTKRILAIKWRTNRKFTLIAGSQKQVESFFTLSPLSKKIVKKNWPGPLSLVVSGRFAVRVPDNRVARMLAQRAGRPLAASSANISGDATPYDSKKIIRQFTNKKDQPDLIIDAGRLKKRKTSTVIKIVAKKITVIRPGAISVKKLTS